MMQPGSLSNAVPGGDDYLVRRLRDLERDVAMLKTARTLQDTSTSAVQVAGDHQGDYDFAVPNGTGYVTAPIQFTVPDGTWSKALVVATCVASVWNPNATADTLYVGIGFTFDGTAPAANMNTHYQGIPPSTFGNCTVQIGDVLTPTSAPPDSANAIKAGTLWRFNARVQAAGNSFAVNASNNLDLIVQAIFIR